MRPHDLDVHHDDPGDGHRGTITRIVRVGFEVRADVQVGGDTVQVVHTRAEARTLGLAEGQDVWVRPVPGAARVEASSTSTSGTDPELELVS